MKRLLLVLPVLALASCSTGHDLMSDKTFQLKCKAPMPGVTAVLTISPLLPQATVVVSNAEQSHEELWNVSQVSPTRLVIENPYGGTTRFVVNRSTGKVSYEDEREGSEIPPKGELECDAPKSL